MRFKNTLGGLFKMLEKINRGNGIAEKIQFKEDIRVTLRNESTGKVKRMTA
jgi:hypothetical protein